MFKTSKLQSGLAPITTVLIIVAVLLFGIGTVYLYQQSKVAPEPEIPQPSITHPETFNLIFKYGVGANNELNTFEGTYTKDMVVDPSITIALSLSNDELNKIYQKMIEIHFFEYPENFSVSVLPGEPVGMVTPHSSYYFKIEYDSKIKELRWEDNITNKDEKAEKLKELIQYIVDIIGSKEEYEKLPEPKGGYI